MDQKDFDEFRRQMQNLPVKKVVVGIVAGVGGILVSSGAPYDIAAYGRTHQTAGDVALIGTLPEWRIHI